MIVKKIDITKINSKREFWIHWIFLGAILLSAGLFVIGPENILRNIANPDLLKASLVGDYSDRKIIRDELLTKGNINDLYGLSYLNDNKFIYYYSNYNEDETCFAIGNISYNSNSITSGESNCYKNTSIYGGDVWPINEQFFIYRSEGSFSGNIYLGEISDKPYLNINSPTNIGTETFIYQSPDLSVFLLINNNFARVLRLSNGVINIGNSFSIGSGFDTVQDILFIDKNKFAIIDSLCLDVNKKSNLFFGTIQENNIIFSNGLYLGIDPRPVYVYEPKLQKLDKDRVIVSFLYYNNSTKRSINIKIIDINENTPFIAKDQDVVEAVGIHYTYSLERIDSEKILLGYGHHLSNNPVISYIVINVSNENILTLGNTYNKYFETSNGAALIYPSNRYLTCRYNILCLYTNIIASINGKSFSVVRENMIFNGYFLEPSRVLDIFYINGNNISYDSTTNILPYSLYPTGGMSLAINVLMINSHNFIGVYGYEASTLVHKLVAVAGQIKTPTLLSVEKIGNGTSTITSNISGINCGTDCSETYSNKETVILTANTSSGSKLDYWLGCDSVNGNQCTVTMDSDKNVIAQFSLMTPQECAALYNTHGWAWSDNVGHISFNCNNDYNGNNTMGPAYMSELENRCSTSCYGVNVSTSTEIVSGYAWSDNIGWISFNQSDLVGCPSGICNAKVDILTGKVSGWGKAINSTNQNYGWISLNGSDYQVNIGLSTGEFHNYAYGGGPVSEAVVGWTSFNCQEGGANQSNICGTSNYLVWTDPIIVNNPPTIGATDTAGPSEEDLCKNIAGYILGWTFQDSDVGAYENTYELKLTNTGTGTSGTYSPGSQLPHLIENGGHQTLGVPVGTNENLSSIPITVKYGQTYIWEVRVQDDGGLWSAWKSGPGSFTIPLNYPEVGFSFSPLRPKIGDEMTFQDTSTDHADGYPIQGYLWNFGDSTTAITENATHTYSEVSPRIVTHVINFNGTKNCSTSTTFNVRPGQGEYIEVIPRTGANIFNVLKKWLLGIF